MAKTTIKDERQHLDKAITPPPPGRHQLLAQNLVQLNRRRAYLTDIYASLLKMKWRYLLALFAASYLLLNALFATIFLTIGGCITGARPGSWSDAFFFSIQTLSTIGYGGMMPKGDLANTLVAIESWLGILGVATFTGIVFAKFARPSARFLFSRVATIYKRNHVPCLVFRVANERGNYVTEANMRATILLEERTQEGDKMRRLYDLELARSFSPIFALSWMAIHVINETSPLYQMTMKQWTEQEGRIIISMSGIDDVFSQTVHTYHVYSAESVIWNAKLIDVILAQDDGTTILDYEHFHNYYRLEESDPSYIHTNQLR